MLIDVSQARPGMILAEDALDLRGRTLVRAGVGLTETHVRALPAWGVTHVDVTEDAGREIPSVTESELAAAAAELEPRFLLCNRSHPAIKMLLAACAGRIAFRVQAARRDGTPW